MEIALLTLTTLFMGYSAIAPEYRNNSLYAFNVDPVDSTIIVMNTQTGHLYRCDREFHCSDGLVLKPQTAPVHTDPSPSTAAN